MGQCGPVFGVSFVGAPRSLPCNGGSIDLPASRSFLRLLTVVAVGAMGVLVVVGVVVLHRRREAEV